MTDNSCTQERFLDDVRDHKMTVIRDDGNFRQLRFQREGSWCYGFDITTWNGYLTISGDMGCYVFARIPDMFEFFREDDPEKLRINKGYWGEKCQAADCRGRSGGIMEFSPELFKEAVMEEYKQHMDSYGDNYTDEEKEALKEALVDDVISNSYDGESRAIDSAMQFSWSKDGKSWWESDSRDDCFQMQDFYEHQTREYTFHYVWCLYAIVWAIRQYDAYTDLK